MTTPDSAPSRRACRNAAAVAAACLAIAAAHAESLEDAWRMAAEHDYGLAAVRSRVESADAEELAARAERWPKLTLDGSYQRFDDAPSFGFPVNGNEFTSPELVSGDDFFMGRARLEVPLFTGGRVTSGIESARHTARGSGLAAESYEQDLRIAVATAYVGVLRADRAVRAAEAAVTSLQSHADDVAVMVERETVARNDLLAARVTLAEARQRLLRAENGQSLARAAYNRILGEPLDRIPELAELATTAPPVVAIEELVERAEGSRHEIAGLDARSLALAERARSEGAGAWPQIGLMADYQHIENQVLDDEDFALFGVGFSWTLFDAGRIRDRASALRSASRAAANDRDDLQSRVALEVRQAWLDVREAAARVPLTEEAVDQADENLRVARELYGAGLATNTVVLDAESLRLTAVTNHDNAVLDVILGNFRLRRATGEL